MEHPFNSIKAFEKWLSNLGGCVNCRFFLNKECTHENSEEYTKAKKELVEIHESIGKPFNLEWAAHIDTNYMCRSYADKE